MSLRTALKIGEALAEGLDLIEKLADVDVSKAAAALTAIRVVLRTLREGFAGNLSPQAVLSRIEVLHETLAKNDAAALEALAKKFGTPA